MALVRRTLRLVAVAGIVAICSSWLAPVTEATDRALAPARQGESTPSAAWSVGGDTGRRVAHARTMGAGTDLGATPVTVMEAPRGPLRLPVPAPLPTDPYAEDPDEPIGRIVIEAIGLDSALGEGMTLTEIDRGPAHWPGTAMPGGIGNVVVAGHRSTWSAPFRHLDLLEPGDEIRLSVGRRVAVYQVTETLVVQPEDVWIAQQGPGRVVTLFACHPVGSAAQRIVVRGELVPSSVKPTAS
jgi:sortase A